ncbi:MAG TPA: prolipoprotein diacylglyceryl transferase family protein [Planctomycetota bacterium]
MHPVLFRLPGLDFPVRTFGALVAAGILLGLWVWGRLLARHGREPAKDPERASQVALLLVIGILVGARLFYVGVEVTRYLTTESTAAMQAYLAGDARAAGTLAPGELEAARRVQVGHDFLHDPFKILLIWQGGLVMYGGLLGGMLLGLHGARKYGLEPWRGLDTGLAAGFVGLAVGRIGCLMVGDDYGSLVPERFESSWRPLVLGNGGEVGPLTIRVPRLEWLQANSESLFDHDLAGKVLWASQPWMSANALLLAAAGCLWLRLGLRPGLTAALLLAQYALSRFVIEAFRGDSVRGVWFGGLLSTSQLVSIVLLVAAGVLFVKRRAAPAA